MNSNRPMSKEESFAQRRKLFQEVWASAVDCDEEKCGSKPKVVKTLNLDDIKRSTGKIKKQKIRNLRAVCHNLLEYCDQQEANVSSARVTEPKNRSQSHTTYNGDNKVIPKTRTIDKPTSLKPSKLADRRDTN